MKMDVMHILNNPPVDVNIVRVDFSVHERRGSYEAYNEIRPLIQSYGFDAIDIDSEDRDRCFYIILRQPTFSDARRMYDTYPGVPDEQYYHTMYEHLKKMIRNDLNSSIIKKRYGAEYF